MARTIRWFHGEAEAVQSGNIPKPSGGYEPAANGIPDEGGSIVNVELLHEALPVAGRRFERDPQGAGELFGALSFDDAFEDLELTPRELGLRGRHRGDRGGKGEPGLRRAARIRGCGAGAKALQTGQEFGSAILENVLRGKILNQVNSLPHGSLTTHAKGRPASIQLPECDHGLRQLDFSSQETGAK